MCVRWFPQWTAVGDSRWIERSILWFVSYHGFTSTFGDIPLWNILGSCVVLPDILTYPCVTHLILWGHVLSVAPETSWT